LRQSRNDLVGVLSGMETLEDRIQNTKPRYDAKTIEVVKATAQAIQGESGEPVLLNSVFAWCCGQFLISTHRHDFRSCDCGSVSVDGGQAYKRRLGRGFYEIESTKDLIEFAQKVPLKS